MNLLQRASPRDCTFRIEGRDGVWSVVRDGAFYGDYLSRAQAISGACYGAAAVEATGRAARVVDGSNGDRLIPHRTAVDGSRS